MAHGRSSGKRTPPPANPRSVFGGSLPVSFREVSPCPRVPWGLGGPSISNAQGWLGGEKKRCKRAVAPCVSSTRAGSSWQRAALRLR
eukprot:80509-Prymnesium_polylepis.1